MRWFKLRDNQILLLILVLMGLLAVRLFSLTVIEGESWKNAAQAISIKSVYTSAPRGEILDRYGRLLAGNRPSFTVQFSKGNIEDEELNAQALEVLGVLEANGDSVNDNLPIIRGADGTYYYTYQKTIENWLVAQGMPKDFTAEEAFQEIRNRNEIDPGLDKYAAQTELQTVYSVYPPISVKKMKYLEDIDKESFLGRYYLEPTLTAAQAFVALRKEFAIDPSLSNIDARKIMVVRNELAAQGYMSYIPATISQDISAQTIVTLEERGSALNAVEVVAESVRYYPNGETAAHVLGYLGQISESEKEDYKKKGYSTSDMVGKDGVEKAFESILKGEDGIKNVEVNAFGDLVTVISDSGAKKGKDIYLTIDLEVQKTAQAALEEALAKIRTAGTFESKYGNYKYGKAYRNANVGAVVAIDVKTGDVIAMASCPAFDPNLFATGISSEDWKSLQSENPRDPLSPLPLFNVGARTAVQPGSTFKMVTATAALESGLDPQRKLLDGGAVKLGNRTYGCLLWNMYKRNHGYVDLYQAMEVSCNYYFYDLAANKDFATGKSLGLSEDMSIEKITSYAAQYGLGLPTGIEIPETVVSVPSQEKKMSAMKTYLKNVLIGRAEMYFDKKTISDKELLMKNIETIVNWTEENPGRKTIMERLAPLGVKTDMIETVCDLCKFSYFNQATWTLGDELNISIGQGENAYTPLQIANYVATIGNSGIRNQVTLLRAIEGSGSVEKEPGQKMDLKDYGILDDITEGMVRVANGSKGSARSVFANFPVTVAAKTGTAQRAGKVNPPDEIEYLKTNLSRINSSLNWEQVETEKDRLLHDYPDIYTTQSSAARQAVINLSRGKITSASIDAYKGNYDSFAWFVAMAPAEDPQIAVAILLFQGGSGPYAGPIAREVIGEYLGLDKTYSDYSLETVVTE
ncbi:MAG: penicillin-binding transpeptidase domain-containing protein [Eubacteriales bacterium]|nr:penicillin-binding transpeptidase domain-containing protein [Eubacteriales bacterium]MDD3350375.1 penicillin-binding transpeptidase domain-containing protein [Eubacteriales bacterium]